MSRATRTTSALFLACLVILLAPVAAEEPLEPAPDLPTNTPAIPVPTAPGSELPRTSEFLTVERVPLSNFSPKVAASSPVLEQLQETALAIDFRLNPEPCRLWAEGHPTMPGALEFKYTNGRTWHRGVPGRARPLFEYLGSFKESHYYISTIPDTWPIADLNARLAGGNLATIGGARENAHIHALLREWNPREDVLIGLTDFARRNNEWYWRSGERVRYANWRGGEPNNYQGREYFVILGARDGKWNDGGENSARYYLMEIDHRLPEPADETVPTLKIHNSTLYLGDLAEISEEPYLERQIYWSKVFHITVGANATYSQLHGYTSGTSQTTGMSFGYSIGISAEAGWGPFRAKIETEFHQDFNQEISIREERTTEKNYQCKSPDGQLIDFALWQLRERFVIRNGEGEEWSDPNYEVEGRLPHLDQGLEQEYLHTLVWRQD